MPIKSPRITSKSQRRKRRERKAAKMSSLARYKLEYLDVFLRPNCLLMLEDE